MSIALLVALPLGILGALYESRPIDRLILVITTLGQAIPSFWLALILMITFGLQLQWLPVSGTESWRHFVMPTLLLGFSAGPALARLTRSGMIRALASDYVRDPELMHWIREGGSTSDVDARRRAYSAAIRRIAERALWMPLYNQVTNYASNRRLSFTAQADELPHLYLAKWS